MLALSIPPKGFGHSCAGTGGVFRMDRQDVQDFVNGYLNP